MTQQVRRTYRNHRRGAWAAVLVVLVAAALAVVIPALGAGAELPPGSDAGVVPTLVGVGGSNFSCTDNTGNVPSGMSTFKISNPPNSDKSDFYDSTSTAGSSTPLPAGVTFTLTGVNGKQKGKYFSFSSSGVRVYHIGVNGGSDTAWYDYVSNGHLNGVKADGNLHATQKTTGDPETLYVASYTTFCYKPISMISGTIWRDQNEDKQIGATEPRQSGWTVTAYAKGSNVAVATSEGSASDGTYSLPVPTGGDYWLCETRPDATETWAQSTPTTLPTSPTQCDSETPNAISTGTVTGDKDRQDFGNLATTTVSCNNTSTSSGGTSQVQPSSKCKSGSGEYVFDAWTQGSAQYVALHPATATALCVSPFTGDNCQYFVQKITWSGLSSAQNPLQYDDNPGNGLSYENMLFCKIDPRLAEAELTLAGGTVATSVLPTATNRSDGDPHTSCLITSTNSVNASGIRNRVDFVFTVSDGYSKVF